MEKNRQETKVANKIINVSYLPTMRLGIGTLGRNGCDRALLRNPIGRRLFSSVTKARNFLLKLFTVPFQGGNVTSLFAFGKFVTRTRAATCFPDLFTSRTSRQFAVAFDFGRPTSGTCSHGATDFEKWFVQEWRRWHCIFFLFLKLYFFFFFRWSHYLLIQSAWLKRNRCIREHLSMLGTTTWQIGSPLLHCIVSGDYLPHNRGSNKKSLSDVKSRQ